MIKQKKFITFHTPYETLNSILWKKKKVAERSCSLNKLLKSKLNQVHNPLNGKIVAKISTQGDSEIGLNEKFYTLAKKAQEQNRWIKETSKNIEEKSYEELKQKTAAVEQSLNRNMQKAKRLMKLIQRQNKKNGSQKNIESMPPNQSELNFFEQIGKQNKELQLFLEYQIQDLVNHKNKIAILNKQVLDLLVSKSKLKKSLNPISDQTFIRKNRISEHIKPNTAQIRQKLTQSLKFKSNPSVVKLKIG